MVPAYCPFERFSHVIGTVLMALDQDVLEQGHTSTCSCEHEPLLKPVQR